MKSRKTLLPLISFLFLLILTANRLMAQVTDVPKMIPPSPAAAGLGIFGNQSANPNTGALSLDIPLYEIKTRKLSVPISIDYIGGGGIKVDERASWVGLGWVLNAGGVICRSIVGNDDLSGFKNNHVPQASEIGPGGNPVYSSYAEETLRDGRDTEPDNFFFSFNGRSGKFIFGNDGAPILIESSGLKILFDAENNFVITDENGVIYKFSTKESVTTTTNGSPRSYVTSWYLSEMRSADGSDYISFNYAQSTSVFEKSYDFSQVYGPTPNLPGCTAPVLLEQESMNFNLREYLPKRLSSIVFESGDVRFVTETNRLDGGGDALKKIEIFAKESATDYKKLKTFQFQQDYFYTASVNPINHSVDDQYRLRLNEIEEYGMNQINPKKHSFNYSSVNLPPVNSFAQDEWGYFNGKTSNTSLLQQQSISTANGLVNIGSADRSVSDEFLEAGLLKKVTYPTRGYSEFEYEPNKYNFSENVLIPSSITCGASGINNTQSYTFVASGFINTTVKIEFRKIGDLTGIQNRPFVRIKDLTTNQQIYFESASATNNINSETSISFIDGHQYELYAEAIGNQQAYAIVTINYANYQNVSGNKSGFGLRLKKVMDYDNVSNPAVTKIYKYGSAESGLGIVLSNTFERLPKSYDQIFQVGIAGSGTSLACSYCAQTRKVFSNGSLYSLSTLNGSPLVYNSISIYNGEYGVSLGKTVKDYQVFTDRSLPVVDGYPNTIMQLPYSWANGKLSVESSYSNIGGDYRLVGKSTTEYTEIPGIEGRGLKIGYRISASGCLITPRPISDFYFFDYPIYTGIRVPRKISEVIFEADGVTPQIVKIKEFTYNENFQLLSSLETGSNNLLKTVNYKYPQEMVTSGNDGLGVYQAMVSKNILNPVIETRIDENSSIKLIKTNFFQPANNLFVPQSLETYNQQTGLNEIRTRFHQYSAIGNLLSFSQEFGVKANYLYSYKSLYPIAEIKNADYATIASLLGGQGAIDTFSQMISPDKATVDAFLAPLRSTLPTAFITSYTYSPLVGMTSQTDAKGLTTYYEYDGFGRLAYIKNQNQDIIKSYCYNYAGQVTDCNFGTPPAITYYNVAKSAGFTRDNCTEGGTGGTITYTIAAGTYSSTSSQADADNQALAAVNAGGQAYANANATCGYIYYNVAKSASFTRNNCTEGGTGGTVTYTIAAGTYSSTSSQADADNQAVAAVNAGGQAYANANAGCTFLNQAQSANFTRNNCGASGTGGTVTYTIAAGTYSSTSSQADADNQAIAAVNAGGQAYANANATCSYLYYNVSQSANFTRNNCGAGGTGGTVTYTIAAGTYSSTSSQADADNQAIAAVNAGGQAYANANATCSYIYYNVAQSANFTRNNCGAGGTGGTVTYTIAAGTYSSTSSQADADNQAVAAVNAGGQAYANANAGCTFLNQAQSANFTRNNCGAGGTGGTVTYTIAAGTYSSTSSQADADNQAIAAVNAGGQAYANANAGCTFLNQAQSANFTKNDCGAGGNGGTVTYSIPAGNNSSSISLADANAQALAALNAGGQAYANANAVCTYYNTERSREFQKTDCAAGIGSFFTHTIAAGLYSSTISQEDANNQAESALSATGPGMANIYGFCTFYNDAQTANFTKNDCTSGGSGGTLSYTIPANTYSSTNSPFDANFKAQTALNIQGQAYANANAGCTFYNAAQSGVFTRTNCTGTGIGGSVTYTVAAGQYSSSVSVADANSQAMNAVNAGGPAYANLNATCTYYNTAQSQNFLKNDCGSGGALNAVAYTVAAGTYSSTVSQAAADQLALNEIAANGQNNANANGLCAVAFTISVDQITYSVGEQINILFHYTGNRDVNFEIVLTNPDGSTETKGPQTRDLFRVTTMQSGQYLVLGRTIDRITGVESSWLPVYFSVN